MSSYYEQTKAGFLVSTNPAQLQIEVIYKFLSQESYWAKDIPLAVVQTSIEHSLCFGLYTSDGAQIGFARVITDQASFAYLADVFILATHRGKGLSKWMLQCIHDHPSLQSLRRWMLATKDAHGLYEQLGWQKLDASQLDRLMQKHQPDIYKKS